MADAAPTHKKCTKCRKVRPLSGFKPRADRHHVLRSHCKQCNYADKIRVKKSDEDRRYRRRGNPTLLYMDIAKAGPVYSALVRLVRGNKRNRSALNNWEWIAKHAHQTICPVTGLPFDLSNRRLNGAPHPLHPSLDRIDPTKGYTPENTRLISFWANISKSTMPEHMFKLMVTSAASNFTRH